MRIRPADCCFVPERRQELTTEGGLDVAAQLDAISAACKRIGGVGARASLFIDPDPRQLQRIVAAVRMGASQGLRVHAGHGLNYQNVGTIAAIAEVEELNIGHAIVARGVQRSRGGGA